MPYKITNGKYESLFASGEYKKIYKPGSVIEVYDTLGFMLFERKIDALAFRAFTYRILYMDTYIKPIRILTVMGIGKQTIPELISSSCHYNKLSLFYINKDFVTQHEPPNGTVCYHKIRILWDDERDD